MDKPILKLSKNFVLELFFPFFCLGCQKEGSLLCQDCKATLEISEHNYCLCDKPLRLPFDSNNGKCQRCKDKKLSGLFYALPYKEKILTKKIIHQFKYEPYIKSLAKEIALIITEHLILTKNNSEKMWQNSVLVPIPIDKRKIKQRGYNQAKEIGQELGQIINVPSVFDNLIKIRKTESQVNLSAKERVKNLKDSFSLKNPKELKGKKVFLIDDVYTTGSTMEECATILKREGVKSVFGIAFAREG